MRAPIRPVRATALVRLFSASGRTQMAGNAIRAGFVALLTALAANTSTETLAQSPAHSTAAIKYCAGYEVTDVSPLSKTMKDRIYRMYIDDASGDVWPEMSTRTRQVLIDGSPRLVRACNFLVGEYDEVPRGEVCLVPADATACPEMDRCCNPRTPYDDAMNEVAAEFRREDSWTNVPTDSSRTMWPLSPKMGVIK